MEREVLASKLNEFLDREKSGDGKNLGKACRDALTKFFADILYDEIKNVMETIPIGDSVPEADASLMSKFKHKIGKDVYYILFRKVKTQKSNSLQVQFGWQYDVLKGRTEEIQIRSDHGILYKIAGDWVLQDLTFADELEAQQRCNELNDGIVGAVMFDVPTRDNPIGVTGDREIEELFTDSSQTQVEESSEKDESSDVTCDDEKVAVVEDAKSLEEVVEKPSKTKTTAKGEKEVK